MAFFVEKGVGGGKVIYLIFFSVYFIHNSLVLIKKYGEIALLTKYDLLTVKWTDTVYCNPNTTKMKRLRTHTRQKKNVLGLMFFISHRSGSLVAAVIFSLCFGLGYSFELFVLGPPLTG